MADSAAAKLAAGRKMLLEFQNKKKTESQPTVLSTTNDDQSPSKTESGIKNIGIATGIRSLNENNQSNHAFPHQGQFSDLMFQSEHAPASDFFDKISDNSCIPAQINHSFPNSVVTENGVQLAGVLFSDKVNNTHESTKSDQHEILFQDNNVESNGSVSDDGVECGQDVRSAVEISKLQQQLQFHTKTVEFLVSEKNELLGKVNEYERNISELKIQNEDLGGRLNTSRHRASHLEIECNNLKLKHQDAEDRASQLSQELATFRSAEHSNKSHQRELEEELLELKTLVNEKIFENKYLSKNIEEMTSQLNSNQLRFQQMLQGNVQNNQDPSIIDKCNNLEKIIKNLQHQLSETESEKNQFSIQFQEYYRQLNQQVQSSKLKEEELLDDNERLQNRESELIQQISDLEKQMQIYYQQCYPDDGHPFKKKDSTDMENLLTENNTLKVDLNKIECSYQTTLEELKINQMKVAELTLALRQVLSDRPDSGKLNAAMESDKLAAQKATAQNAKMKIDLQELEKAFEQMTRSKLELVELLQAEKDLSKTLTLKLVENEELLKETKSHLHAKDEEMIRLQAASSDLQKEIFIQAQITDRLNHYEAQGQSSELLQTELQTTKNIIQALTEENDKLKLLHKNDVSETHSTCNHHLKDDSTDKGEETNNEVSVHMPTDEAMIKLQERFTKLMQEVAELSDEKQKLEHIVLQLQGETETICEYIALYQKQRNILKQRENEKNIQLNHLAKERENIKAQLDSLRSLITSISESDHIPADKSQTSEKIMNILTQIKESHLIEPDENCGGLDNFHPCPCCSGKLINV